MISKAVIIITIRLSISLIILVGFLLTSCVGAVQMFPTETPTPNLTIAPTATATVTQTPTPIPTPTPEPTPTLPHHQGPIATAIVPLRLGRTEYIYQGGFSFKAPVGYSTRYQPNQVTLTSIDEDTVFSLLGGKVEREEELEADFQDFIDLISLSIVELDVDEIYPYMVGGVSGLAARVNGMYGENKITGRILVIAPQEDQLFYALAISPDIDNGEGWEPEGRKAFEAMLRTVSFFEPTLEEE